MRMLVKISGAIVLATAVVSAGLAQPAEASGPWDPYQAACASGAFSWVGTKADGRAEFRGTMLPCAPVPAGGYFALTAYQTRLAAVHGYVAARILYDAGPSTYFDVPLTVADGDRVCLSSSYSTRQACVVLHTSNGQWTSAAVAPSDPSVNVVINEPYVGGGGGVSQDPKCGTCW